MRNTIKLEPPTRVNDNWISDGSIQASTAELQNWKHPLISGGPNASATRYQADFYRHVSLDIVAETVLNYPYAYISEKTFRPIACKRMFIILGAKGSLQLLHSLGFTTWGDFIDESYDTIDDPVQRFLSVKNEVIRICHTPLDAIKLYMSKNLSKLEHNFSTLKNLQNRDLRRIASEHGIDIGPHDD